MKTLLLSLIGIVGSTSSSIIPVVMSNQHNVNQIKTGEEKLKKQFSYKLNTSNPVGGKTYNYNTEFSNFISGLRSFTRSPRIKEWKLVHIWSEFKERGQRELDVVTDGNLNKALHANSIENIQHSATVEGPVPDRKNPWNWHLKGSFVADGKLYEFPHLDAYYDQDYGFTTDELNGGFTNTFYIEYIAEDKIDISAGNFKDSPITKMNFLTTDMKDFRTNTTLNSACAILKDLGFDIKPEWLTFKGATWLETKQAVTDDLLQGKLGAGEYHISVKIAASTLGIENNITGKMNFFMTLKFEYGDLNTYNNHKLQEQLIAASYAQLTTELHIQMRKTIITSENAFALWKEQKEFILMPNIYFADTGEKLTEEKFKELAELSIYDFCTFVYPDESGKKLGILNSAKVYFKVSRM